MPKPRKSWQEKLADDHGLPFIETIPEKMESHWGKGTLCVPAPREVVEIMHSVPHGKLITINQIREAVAKKHGTTIG